jgi:Arc/MetJ family transcription regulator
MIFKGVRDGKPYPEHGLSIRDWSRIPPRQLRLDEIVTTTKVLELDRLLSEDSTFYGDLFPHAVQFRGVIYLVDGLHRAVRAALRSRTVLHARVFDYDALGACGFEGPRTLQPETDRSGRGDGAHHGVGEQPAAVGQHEVIASLHHQPVRHGLLSGCELGRPQQTHRHP